VIKRGPQGETVYVNQFFSMRNRSVGTKHVYAGKARLVSKLVKQENTSVEAQNGKGKAGKATGKKNPSEAKWQYFYHPDHLGSSAYVTDYKGSLYQHLEYFAFGETFVEQSSNTQRTPYEFTAKELDEETGLYYFGARYYDPRTSVWVSPDPILGKYLPTGDEKKDQKLPGMGGVFNSSNLGLYTYGHYNPVKFVDPDGRVIKVTGSKNDIKTFINLAYKATGIKLENKKGTLVQVGKRNTKVGSKLASEVLTLATQSKDEINLKIVKDDPNVLIDSFASKKVDVGDLSAFFKKSNRFGAGALSHVINEQAYSIVKGTGYGPAHKNAVDIENQIMGASKREVSGSGSTLNVKFFDSSGKEKHKYTFTRDSNNTPQ